MKNKFVGILYILLAVVILFLNIFFVNIINNDGISRKNSVTTEATIINLSDVQTNIKRRRKSFFSKIYYTIYIQFSYDVNGNQYINTDSYEMTDRFKLLNKFNINDKITITYDNTNPNNCFIGKANYDISTYIFGIFGFTVCIAIGFAFIFNKDKPLFKLFNNGYVEENPKFRKRNVSKYSIIGILIFAICIILEYRTNKIYESESTSVFNTGHYSTIILVLGIMFIIFFIYKYIKYKNVVNSALRLKVLQVDIIDYERERVFFSSNKGIIYFYETDFGEDFKEEQTYSLDLTPNNQKITHINFEGQNIKAIHIVNIEKSSFVKIDTT